MTADQIASRKAEIEAQISKRLQQRQQVQDALVNLDRELIGLQAIYDELNRWDTADPADNKTPAE